MLRPLSFTSYIFVIGIFFALAATRPCLGYNDALGLSRKNDENANGIIEKESLRGSNLLHDKRAEERYLDDQKGVGKDGEGADKSVKGANKGGKGAGKGDEEEGDEEEGDGDEGEGDEEVKGGGEGKGEEEDKGDEEVDEEGEKNEGGGQEKDEEEDVGGGGDQSEDETGAKSVDKADGAKSQDEGGEGDPDDEGGEGEPDDEAGEGEPADEADEGGEGEPDDEGGEGEPDDEGGEGEPADEGGDGEPADEGGEGEPADEEGEGEPDDEGGEGEPADEGGEGEPADEGGEGEPEGGGEPPVGDDVAENQSVDDQGDQVEGQGVDEVAAGNNELFGGGEEGTGGGGGEIGNKSTEGEKSKSSVDTDAETGSTPIAVPPSDNWDGDWEEPQVGKYVIGFFALVGIVIYFKFCRKRGHGSPMASPNNRSHGKGKYETVAADDFDGGDGDDWGWDDPSDTGDVELAASNNSLPIPTPTGMSLKQRSPSIERRDVKSPSATRQKGLQLKPNKQNHSLAQPTLQTTSPQMNTQAPRITSLGAPPPAAKKAPVRKQPKEDDIFASMGLAAQPKFQASRPAGRLPPGGPSSTSSGWGAVAASPASTPKATAAPSAFDADGDDWGNDDDLDDLFDD